MSSKEPTIMIAIIATISSSMSTSTLRCWTDHRADAAIALPVLRLLLSAYGRRRRLSCCRQG
jgi:hypothetical protein